MDAKFFESLFEGDSPNGVKLGMGLTGGDFWPRPAGCQNLYRGRSMVSIDLANILAVADITATELGPPGWLEHQAATTYFYIVRRANSCGAEERTLGAAVKIALDSNGNLSEPVCNSVFSVRARQKEGDKVELVWFYWPIEQKAACDCFRVYSDNGTGQIDYENAAGQIKYVGRQFYTFQSGPMSDEKNLFCIRALTKAGLEDGFLGQIKIQLNTTKPEAIEVLEIVAI